MFSPERISSLAINLTTPVQGKINDLNLRLLTDRSNKIV
jgi:hypothetical protein